MTTNAFTTLLPELLAKIGREWFNFDGPDAYTFDETFPGLVNATRLLFGDCKARLAPGALGEDESWFEWRPSQSESGAGLAHHFDFWNAEGLRAVAATATKNYEWAVYYQYNPDGHARVLVLVWFTDDPAPPVSAAVFEIEDRSLVGC